MQINSTSNISDQYLSALQSKQKETSTGNFEEERSQIKFMIGVSNNFSEDDVANEAVFMEAKSKVSSRQRQEFSIQMAKETSDFMLGTPTISDVLRVSGEYLTAIQSGIDNPQA